jgi:hypothetical protein
MTIDIDSEMNVTVQQAEANPMVFTPDVDIFGIKASSIIDDF